MSVRKAIDPGLAKQTCGMIAEKWITVKVQYSVCIIRIETREVQWMEGVGGKIVVW
jgi:hypothetical protein